MRSGPTGGGFVDERAEVAAGFGLELDLVAERVGELEWIGERAFVHRDERRAELGGVAAGQRMLVVSGGEDEDVPIIRLLDGAQELLAARPLLELVLRDTQREVDDLAPPLFHGPM